MACLSTWLRSSRRSASSRVDGNRLVATQWFEDPAVLENNGARFIQWAKQEGQYVFPYECDPSFVLEYQQTGEGEGE